MSRATYQITVWSTYRSTTNTYFDNHELGVRPVHEYIRLCYNPELKLTNTDLYSRKHHSEINTARKNIAPIAAVACAVMDTGLSLDTCCDKRNFFFGGVKTFRQRLTFSWPVNGSKHFNIIRKRENLILELLYVFRSQPMGENPWKKSGFCVVAKPSSRWSEARWHFNFARKLVRVEQPKIIFVRHIGATNIRAPSPCHATGVLALIFATIGAVVQGAFFRKLKTLSILCIQYRWIYFAHLEAGHLWGLRWYCTCGQGGQKK